MEKKNAIEWKLGLKRCCRFGSQGLGSGIQCLGCTDFVGVELGQNMKVDHGIYREGQVAQ